MKCELGSSQREDHYDRLSIIANLDNVFDDRNQRGVANDKKDPESQTGVKTKFAQKVEMKFYKGDEKLVREHYEIEQFCRGKAKAIHKDDPDRYFTA